jgi:hypothetical protein
VIRNRSAPKVLYGPQFNDEVAMKTFILSVAAAAALAGAALPAAAQPRYQGGYDDGYQQRGYQGDQRGYDDRGYRGGRVDYHLTSGYVDGLFWKLDNAAQEGRLNWGEANQLKRDLRQVQEFAHPVETGQARPWQRRRLEQTVARIDQALTSGPYRGERYRR